MLFDMSTEPGNDVIRVWTRLMRAQQTALAEIETALKQADLPPLAWYDVLLELDRAAPDGLRPFALERALLLPQYGLSRLLDRIEAAGYLERRPCPEDGRGQIVVISKSGKALRRRMWPVYARALNAAIGDRLAAAEAKALAALLDKLLDAPAGAD